MRLLTHLIDAAKGKHPLGAARSGKWPAVRKQHLALHPTCEVCGGKEKLEVHHKVPFHVHPELELDPRNLVTLCEVNTVFNCHRIFGHLNNFKGWNPAVIQDAKDWRDKLAENEERIKKKGAQTA